MDSLKICDINIWYIFSNIVIVLTIMYLFVYRFLFSQNPFDTHTSSEEICQKKNKQF